MQTLICFALFCVCLCENRGRWRIRWKKEAGEECHLVAFIECHVGGFVFTYLFMLSSVDGDNMGYMLSCREEEGYSSEAIFLCFCVVQIILCCCEKKPGNRGRCGVGGVGGGHSGSGN